MPVGAASAFLTRNAPAITLVPDGSGFLAAWSAGAPSHIFAARLDASFKPTVVREIEPYLGPAYDAIYPDIAAVDGGYAIVWLERERINQPRASAVILRRLSPSFEPSPATQVTWTVDTGIARIAGSDGGVISVLEPQGFIYKVDVNGGSSLTKISDFTVDDAVFAHGAPAALTAAEYRPPAYSYYPFCGWPCPMTSPHWAMRVQVNHAALGATFDNEIAKTTIGFGGGMYLVAWLSDVTKQVGQVNAVRIRADGQALDNFFFTPRFLGTFTPGGAAMRPSIASDGQRFVIAWQSGTDLVGASMLPNGITENFTLAAAPAAVRSPILVFVTPGRFALAYETQSDAEHRQLNFRYVDFVKFRQRSSR